MKWPLALLLLASLAFPHAGEAVEEHTPLEIFLSTPLYLGLALAAFLLLAYAAYLRLPEARRNRSAFLLASALVAALFAGAIYNSLQPRETPLPYHAHADFKVYINGEPLNFSQEKYMSTSNGSLDPRAHLHDLDGGVIHHHAKNVTLSYFFRTLNMTFNSTCFVTDAGESFCSGEGGGLRMFVKREGGQWAEENSLGNYVFSDLDRILITFGNETAQELSPQMDSVTDKSCIQSGTCPGRGVPTDADCAGDYCIGEPQPIPEGSL